MGWLAQHQTCLCQMGSIFLTGARGSLLTRYQDWLTGFKIDLKGERSNIRPWQTVKDPFQLNPFYDSMTQQHFLEQKNVATNFPAIQLRWKVWISSSPSCSTGLNFVTKVFLTDQWLYPHTGCKDAACVLPDPAAFTKPQHLILFELNGVRTAGENACECSWKSSLYSINF